MRSAHACGQTGDEIGVEGCEEYVCGWAELDDDAVDTDLQPGPQGGLSSLLCPRSVCTGSFHGLDERAQAHGQSQAMPHLQQVAHS